MGKGGTKIVGLILCSGRGTRLREETKDKPKCMVEVENKPVLEHIADHMNKHGIWRIVVNLHKFPEVVMKHFGQRFLYLYEPVPMGAFATIVLVSAMFPSEPILVTNGDTITDFWPDDLFNRKLGDPSIRYFSEKTGRHMGTSLICGNAIPFIKRVNCEYFDIGTPEKLAIARKHYGN